MPIIQYRIAVVGEFLTENAELRRRLSARLAEIRKNLDNQCEYQLCFLTPSEGLSSAWEGIRQEMGIDSLVLPTPQECTAGGEQIQGHARRMLVQISDLADLVLGVWNEDPDGSEAYIWETLHRCMEKNVPCLWISEKDGAEYWAEQILFEPYQDGFLRAHLDALRVEEEWEAPVENLPWGNRGIDWGERLYQRMLKNYAAVPGQEQSCEDRLAEHEPFFSEEQAEAVRIRLLNAYQEYDSRALRLSERYRGSIYWRSILPMIATILLAIGFYADAVSQAVIDLLRIESGVPRFVFLLMSFAFFFHALMILGSHLLARNRVIQSWHTHFLYCRMVAEILRFYVHIFPFGITLPLNRILSKSGFDTTGSQPVYVRIWQILHDSGTGQPAYREANVPAFLDAMEQYLLSQLDYHKRSAARFQNLRNKLRKLETWLVSAGILTVVLRGIAQFFIIGVNKNLILLGSGLTLPSYSGSIANMCAMVIPAVASFYTGKLTLFGFEDSISMSRLMEERLVKAIERVRSMKGRDVNYSMIRNLAEQIAILLMGDVASWDQEIAKRKIKGL